MIKWLGQAVCCHFLRRNLAHGNDALLEHIAGVVEANVNVLRSLRTHSGGSKIDCALVVHVHGDRGIDRRDQLHVSHDFMDPPGFAGCL